MDDILASIRRILKEDDHAEPASPNEPREAAAAEPEPIDLTEDMLVSAPEPSSNEPTPPRSAAPLVAPAVAEAAAASVGELVRAVAAERHSGIGRPGSTIEDVVREEIRPLLKSWLDQHLPPIVERLVRQEIERVMGRLNP